MKYKIKTHYYQLHRIAQEKYSIVYIEHEPIEILNNSQFHTLALPENENWNGSGTELDPYIIRGYHISADNVNLIYIENTSVFFE